MTASDWLDPMNDLPGWQDLGRAVWVKREDGSVESGRLTYEDMTPGPDEYPLVLVEYRVGNTVTIKRESIYNFVAFRYLS